jgi:protocatechuate 3,4-dioxygenase beta subunit
MKRKDFFKGIGITALGTMLPFNNTKAKNILADAAGSSVAKLQPTCILIPTETAGPFVYDLSNNPDMYRQDIREGNAGIPLNLTLTIVNVNDNCNPIGNARVDIWHCNKDGYYSEFNNQNGYLGTQNHAGETFFRGIQLTNCDGQVQFTTIYPGWYPGRVTHIHFRVYLGATLSATSQMAFPPTVTTTVYNTALYSAHGQNPTTNNTDNVFSDAVNTQYELLTVTENPITGGYDGSLVIGVAAPASYSALVISGSNQACSSGVSTYSIPNPSVGSTIVWSVTSGTIVSGQGTAQITVQWNNGTEGTVDVNVF